MERKKFECNAKTNSRIIKKLCYILRYGAVKENLLIDVDGYVDLNEMMKLPIIPKWIKTEDIMNIVDQSISYNGNKRFESKNYNGNIAIRAAYGRHFQRNPYHEGSKVKRLLDNCLDYIQINITNFDMQYFPDEYLINELIRRLKHSRKLNNKTLDCILSVNMDHLDLDGFYLTEKSLKIIQIKSPLLKCLSLNDSGYFLTDHYLFLILKHLKLLENLNISGAKSLTDKSLANLGHSCIKYLNLSWIENFSIDAIVKFLIDCKKLKYVDFYSHRTFNNKEICMIRAVLKCRLCCRKEDQTTIYLENEHVEMFNSSLSVSGN